LIDYYPSIHCTISGGEPTVSPHFEELVDMLWQSGSTIGITTNGVRNEAFWEKIAPRLSYICFSYHPSQEVDRFLEKAVLAAQWTQSTIRVMMDSRHWDRSVDMFNRASQHPIRVEAVRILEELATRRIGNEYTSEQEEWLRTVQSHNPQPFQCFSNPNYRPSKIGSSFLWSDGTLDEQGDTNKLITLKQNDFRGWACNIGLESLFVHYNGTVKKGNCDVGGDLFHLNDHQAHQLPTMAEICTQRTCDCGTDVLISKVPVLPVDSPLLQNLYTGRQIFNDPKQFEQQYKKYIKIKPQ
jgi:hypothetical protein